MISRSLLLISVVALFALTACQSFNPGIYKGADGKFRPKKGFVWDDQSPSNMAVKPAPGYHWKYPHDKSNFMLLSPTGETINPFTQEQ